MVKSLINRQVSDLIEATLGKLGDLGIKSISDLDGRTEKIVDFSDAMKTLRKPLRGVLLNKLYKHYRVIRMSNKASRFLKELFKIYSDNPDQLPPQALEEMEQIGKYEVIRDYIAGMTDRYALDQYKKLFEPCERV